MSAPLRVVVRGTGDVGSAVAHVLHSAGMRVVMHDVAAPAHTRRGMSFTDAMFEGKAELAGLFAKRSGEPSRLREMLNCGRAVPVVAGDVMDVVREVAPDALIDARMRKRAVPECQRDLARCTIGLGPNFTAGQQTDVAVETGWGDSLGSVVRAGATRPLEGEPREIAGYGRARYLYAPSPGVFVTTLGIGARVQAGELVGSVGDARLLAPLSGRLRGLTHSGVAVEAGTKVVEVDPREEAAEIYGLGARPHRIALGVLEALRSL